MEQLFEQQENIFSLIKKTGANFKKTPKVRLTKSYVQIRIQTIDQHWEQFRNTHHQIIKLATKDVKSKHQYFLEEWFEQGEETYIEIKTDMLENLETIKTVETPTTCSTPSGKQQVKLPVINIPKFSGNYNDWSTFRDLFTSLIDRNESLSKVQKLHYLKSSLIGEPEQLLKHIATTESNYDIAWNILMQRFNNKRVIVNNILNRLVYQRKMYSGTSKGIKELLDTTRECMNNLEINSVPIDNWDIMIIYLVANKLDDESRRAWEEELGSVPVDTLPTLKKFMKFLDTRFRVLEMISTHPNSLNKRDQTINPKTFLATSNKQELQCNFCKDDHLLYHCKKFIKQNVNDRVKHVQQTRLCFNCFSNKHAVLNCQSKSSCIYCHKRHHTLLHYPQTRERDPTTNTSTNEEAGINQTSAIRSHLTTQGQHALLATALIHIQTGKGLQLVRALIDPCSQESFISEAAAQRLQLYKKPVEGHVIGVDQMSTRIKFSTYITIFSRIDMNLNYSCIAYGVQHVTDVLPMCKVSRQQWPHLQCLSLADPTFDKPGPIDMLLGVNVYTEILMSGVLRGDPKAPIAQQTTLGWIISGGIINTNQTPRGVVSMHLNLSLESMLQKFWETERLESEDNDTLTPLETRAENIYEKTVRREPNGRYVVALPFKSEIPTLPENSKEIAIKRLMSLEKRLSKNEDFREKYNEVMREYITLKHMEPVKEMENKDKAVYLPHHAVIREDRETTKVRAVYDASCKGSNGVSLNDELLIGPSLQKDIRDILLRWRVHRISFVADVIKMYRQILVRREDVDYQRIVWRFSQEEPIQDYRLLTVTFGLSSAPYLAMRTLRQLAKDETRDKKFERVCEIINNDVYMDDIISGSDTVEFALETQQQLTEMLLRGGFELQKWFSNSDEFMSGIQSDKQTVNTQIDINSKEKVKALGVTWNGKRDELQITNKIDTLAKYPITKRSVLSIIATLFDPMGWFAPIVVLSKIFMQKLWKLELSWDETLPEDYQKEWLNYHSQFKIINDISIPRWIGTSKNIKNFELHGFSDASTVAYAAVVYSRVMNFNGEVNISLLMSKTRVAPVKQVTLPRLELCAAVLLSQLLKRVMNALHIDPKNTYAWSDSQITLAWIRGDPMRWKTYVRNRVIEIINNVQTNWNYINTKDNPADPASRGMLPEKLKTNELWWKGPTLIRERTVNIPMCEILETTLEVRDSVVCTTIKGDVQDDAIFTLLRRFSLLKKLLNVVAYCRRWILLKLRKETNIPTYVTHEEREEALTICIRWSQEAEFNDEMIRLRDKKSIRKESKLITLNPFLDDKGVLRIGGRLKHADLEFICKHPVIISNNNILLPLLLREAHSKTLHGGPQMMITYLRGKYWLIKAVNTVKRFVRNCLTCAKQRNVHRTQLMGNLPEVRVRPSRPFAVSGVDFAGPILARLSKGRGSKSHKAYIALFICMATKAIHIELVSDMTTDTFMAAFRRFVSRRGPCKEIWSDHGTTFVAASKEIIEMWRLGKSNIPDELSLLLDHEGTKWKYIPPGAPNFGGLWEAGVKSIKFHLKRTVGDMTLTFEELNTLLIQIEACLNSRPLSPISDHPEDLEPLTPAHFLVGTPLMIIPERNYEDLNLHSLTRWQRIQKMLQCFWKKWQTEYMTRLQQRPKWTCPKREFDIGDLVLIRDTRYPPSKWLLGRISKGHQSKDELTRVYDIRTASGVITRAVSKLCPLPV